MKAVACVVGLGYLLLSVAAFADPLCSTPCSSSFVYSAGTFTAVSDPNGYFTALRGINNAGELVGSYSTPGSSTPFLYSSGTFTDLDYPGPGGGADLLAINNTGTIVGAWQGHGLIHTSAGFSLLDRPGALDTFARGVNDSGVIVGSYIDATDHSHGFIYQSGAFQTLDAPFGAEVELLGINNAGAIIGLASATDTSFIYFNGVFTPINVPGAQFSLVTGINNAGVVVGEYEKDDRQGGFLLNHGVYSFFDYSGSAGTALLGINDQGDVIGVTTFTPEPASFFLMFSGVSVAGSCILVHRKRRSVTAA